MATIDELMLRVKLNFPDLDDPVNNYIRGILENEMDEFEDPEQIFEAFGDILDEMKGREDQDVKEFCGELFAMIDRPDRKVGIAAAFSKALNLELEDHRDDIDDVWLHMKDSSLKVDQRKLAKAKAKLLQKQEKRMQAPHVLPAAVSDAITATATQVTTKKDSKLDAKGSNRTTDIHLQSFDVAFGDRVLIKNSDVTLSYTRRYGLVGRNGVGKTTLLRLLSLGQLKIPSNITVLHVEQEVTGDDTCALESILLCDIVRNALISREMELTMALNKNSADSSIISSELSEVYCKLSAIEADKAPAKASVILAGLGFTPEMQTRPTKEFSGGWRMRLALARALFSVPDLLLLDEPTNMLDMKAIIWLENYLQTWPTTLLVVSHDRNFLETVPTDILHLHSQRIDTYRGNYKLFERARKEKLKSQQRELDAQLAQRQHVQEFIDRFRYNANRASSVQSKIKMLEKMPELQPLERDLEVTLKFPDCEHLSPPVIQVKDVSFGYIKSEPILKGVNIGANVDSRICIVGDNGAGKSTLLKLITGILSPTAGEINVHRNIRFGYFSQHHVDQLDMNMCSVELLQKNFPGNCSEEYRRHLGAFGITGNLSLQPIRNLSGGQKSRVTFAKMCMKTPNFLILDEPTNHLDIETIDALSIAIRNYKGGVILVSHDEKLVQSVCSELWVCGKGTVKSVENFNAYRVAIEKELAET